jgi:hypothetical protein
VEEHIGKRIHEVLEGDECENSEITPITVYLKNISVNRGLDAPAPKSLS